MAVRILFEIRERNLLLWKREEGVLCPIVIQLTHSIAERAKFSRIILLDKKRKKLRCYTHTHVIWLRCRRNSRRSASRTRKTESTRRGVKRMRSYVRDIMAHKDYATRARRYIYNNAYNNLPPLDLPPSGVFSFQNHFLWSFLQLEMLKHSKSSSPGLLESLLTHVFHVSVKDSYTNGSYTAATFCGRSVGSQLHQQRWSFFFSRRRVRGSMCGNEKKIIIIKVFGAKA